jgi:hypothetical protein
VHDAQLGLEYRRKILRRSYRTYLMANVGNRRRGVAYPLEDLGIAGLEHRILEPEDIVAWATWANERRRESGRDRLIKRHGISGRRAVESDRIKRRRERRHASGAG